MWIRFKKRTRPGRTLYHWFEAEEFVSICQKEVRREKDKYGRERQNYPKDQPVCRRCRERKITNDREGYRELLRAPGAVQEVYDRKKRMWVFRTYGGQGG